MTDTHDEVRVRFATSVSLSEAQSLRMDAARYRWIRDRPGMLGPSFCELGPGAVDSMVDALRLRTPETQTR